VKNYRVVQKECLHSFISFWILEWNDDRTIVYRVDQKECPHIFIYMYVWTLKWNDDRTIAYRVVQKAK
jgi:hypothetical protein